MKKHEHEFPNLANLAKRVLVVKATSASSEQMFSKASLIISNKRTSLNPGIAGTLLYFSQNFHWVRNQIFNNSLNYLLNNKQGIIDGEYNFII